MKKSLIIVIILVIVIAIIGVVYFASLNKEQPTNANEQQESINHSVTYTLDYEGKNMTPGQAFSKEIFGEEEQYSEIPSCAFEGSDKVYNYGSYEIITSQINGEEKIYSVSLLDDTISTKEGIKLADDRAKMIEIYGENYRENGTEYIYTDGNVNLSFILQNDVIISIQYTMVTE